MRKRIHRHFVVLLILLLACTMIFTNCGPTGKKNEASKTVAEEPLHPFAQKIQNKIIASDLSAESLLDQCEKAILELNFKVESTVTATKVLERVSFESSLLPLETAKADFADDTSPLYFMAYVSTDANLRKAGSDCEQKVSEASVALGTRRDVYEMLLKINALSLEADEARLLSETLLVYKKNGMALSNQDLAAFRELRQKLSLLESQFSQNLNEDVSTAEFTKEELVGTSERFLSRLSTSASGKLIVTTKSTDYREVMANAINPETRKKMMFAYLNRAGEQNTKLLKEAILLRQAIAKLLGYKTWAHYRIDGRMAATPENAKNLIVSLKDRVAQVYAKDRDLMLESKREDLPSADRLEAWDLTFYTNKVAKERFSLDRELVRQYFPAEKVVAGVFEIYSKLFAVKFEEVVNAHVWSEDVKLYAVRSADDNSILSYFYADLTPRPGKYGHAAAFPLISGRIVKEGYYSQPVAAIVANFTPGNPSLMSHSEVETFFHEFGHIVHQTLTGAPYASLSGTDVAQDFVEAPSQMLEEWAWDKNILKMISGHFERPREILPDSLIDKMVAAKHFGEGLLYATQILYGLTDLTFHMAEGSVDVHATYDQLYKEILLVEPLEGGRFVAGFGHLMGGYDAGYYGYIWSEVYAADMFTRFEKEGLLNANAGEAYRKWILEPGRMLDPLSMIESFLGRPYSTEAFYRKLGL
ncbi:MAG: peptidase [Bdellovibrionales bacterium CG10_big_fil_rev_8_21_14_0_10_45_34]|nr:MAG: peptidase [Bdellovibrionales bacterium CG10_big_fil_rev_8_21_14_0_10_45_34]